MDIAAYKQSVKSYTDDTLISQYHATLELREMSWDNAQDSNGEEMENYLNEYDEANTCLKVLENEISFRHIKL